MSDSEAISQFIAITSSTPASAIEYLNSAKGDVEAAVDAYFAGDAAGGASSPELQEGGAARRGSQQGRQEPYPAGAQFQGAPKHKAATMAPGKIRGLADLGKSDDESEEDESNEYYTGGHKSGMVVKGGDGKKGSVDSYFEQLKNAGAQMGNPEDLEQPAGPSAFFGRSRKLGDGDAGLEPKQAQEEDVADPNAPLVHTITFWTNQVFTVNDGEPRSMSDPANRAFLEAIGRGTAPPELLPSNPATAVTVNLVRKGSDYEAPARSVAFTGRGRTLAGDAPSGSKAIASTPPMGAPSQTAWEGVDSLQPTTSIQIRLADGSRMVASFNHSHTVADIRRFIAASRPDMTTRYGLMTAFPSAQLTNDSKTIADAGLLNAVIMQKL